MDTLIAYKKGPSDAVRNFLWQNLVHKSRRKVVDPLCCLIHTANVSSKLASAKPDDAPPLFSRCLRFEPRHRFELRLRFRSACCLRSESRRHNEALRIRREIIPASTRIRRGTACCARQTYLATALRISLSWPLGVLSSTRCGSSTPANVSAQAIARPTNGHLAASVAFPHSSKTFPCNRFLQTANRQPSC